MDVYKLWTCDDNSKSQLSSTSSELEKEIDVLRKTFDFVRLLKADSPHGVSGCVENMSVFFFLESGRCIVKTVYP